MSGTNIPDRSLTGRSAITFTKSDQKPVCLSKTEEASRSNTDTHFMGACVAIL